MDRESYGDERGLCKIESALVAHASKLDHNVLVVFKLVFDSGVPMMRAFALILVSVCCVQLFGQEETYEILFNGTDLSGWYGAETMDPRKVASMTEPERAQWREKFKAATAAHWTVENQEIVNDGKGPFLTTEREFENYELQLEYKTVAQADSGIYLKATPQVQIWDFTEAGGKWNIGADKGSGGLWNNSPGADGKDPLRLADKPFGQWNQVRVIQIGARTTVYLNDQLVVDLAIMENYWDRKIPLIRKGPIQLQTHGGEIRWRNIKVREFTASQANRFLAGKDANEFETVFNGKDFEGWQGPLENYQVLNGNLVCKAGKGGTIFTEREYSDFQVRLEIKFPPKGNNGLAIRYPGNGDTAYFGMCELQVLNYDYPNKLDARQYHGSAYGMVAAQRGYLRETGEWNFQEVTVVGSKIKVELNGYVILDCDLTDVSEFLGDKPHPGMNRTSGYFGFAGHSDPVQFRNVRIREIKRKNR